MRLDLRIALRGDEIAGRTVFQAAHLIKAVSIGLHKASS